MRKSSRARCARVSCWSALPLAAVLICAGAGFAYARQQSEQQQDQQKQQQYPPQNQQPRQQQPNADELRNPSPAYRDVTSLTAPTTLSEENIARVAASADEIKYVLLKDAGLMVELKRWIAIDDTNHGKVVDDEELTEDAIFTRLDKDQLFRGIATRLLQRYGYLTPKFSIGSEAELEQQLQREADWNQMERATLPENGTPRTPRPGLNGASSPQQNNPGGTTPGNLNNSLPENLLPQLPFSPQNGLQSAPGLLKTSYGDISSEAVAAVGTSTGTISAAGSLGGQFDGMNAGTTMAANVDAERPQMNRELSERATIADEMQMNPTEEQRNANELLPPSVNPAGQGQLPNGYSGLNPDGSVATTANGVPGLYPPMTTEKWNRMEEEAREKASEPLVERAQNPFADVPSLYDLYQRVSPRQPELKLFGASALETRSKTTSLPMDLPAGPDYVLGPGDSLYIDLWGSASQRIYRVVDREGRISLPEVGPLPVSGHNMGEVQSAVQQALRSQFRDISADVSLARLRTVRVYVVGEVENPGAYDISSLSTPLNALVTAGGTTPRGSLRRVQHMRGNQLVQEVDVYDLLLRGVRDDLARIEPGDTLQVPPAGPRVTIEGMVRRPAIYELRDETNLAQALNLAGGVLPTASLRHIEVERVEAHEKRTVLSVDIPLGDEAAATKQLEGFKVNDGDVIRILSIAPATQDAVYLQGHVLRPGRYSYKDGMRVTDMVSSYSDLMPEPDTYAEIIRLAPPDFHPEVEAFNLAAAIANPSSAPKLEPLDTIRIYSRYDFENVPTVFVGGEVRKPGSYRTTGEIHLRDAVYQAGGLTPDASLDSAQLIRYNDDGSLRITPVNLGRAMNGDPLENLVLSPRDRLMIQRKRDRVDPPTVYLRGEVASPGRFPLTANLTVRDLIDLGGGLKRSAFTGTADITRYLGNDPNKQFGEHFQVDIAKAMAGDSDSNITLHDGDVLTIALRPGWDDRGASVTITGEITHAGTYGIKPGERLSSVLARAGYFLPTAYPQAAVFERKDVKDMQEKTKKELIARIEQQVADVKVSVTASATEQAALQQAAFEQRERVLEALEKSTVTGRMVIHLTPGLKNFAGSPNDIELRAGDTLFVPKRPEFVIVSGQVYNANAMTYEPRRNVAWYLSHAGGITSLADKKGIFVVRADGSVVSGRGSDWWEHSVMSTPVYPGDSIIVPEKAIGGSSFWRNLIGVAGILESASVSTLALKSAGL